MVGNSGAGKTQLARRIAERLDLPHLELDGLQHRADWEQAPVEELRAEVTARLRELDRTHDGWVADGNYRQLGDVLRPDTYVWLDYPRRVVLARLVRRTAARLLLRRELWNGNRERWRNALSRDPMKSVVMWSWTQHHRYRETYGRLSAADANGGPAWIRLRDPKQTERWLRTL